MTEQEATELLAKDLIGYEARVLQLVDVPLTQGQMDALVSFAYNCGPSALANSTLLRKLNNCEFSLAADEFLKWNKVAGKPMQGLTNRRQAEREMFLGV
jgi:GH24 family phage-related lysozyme (muramidase)